MFFQTLEDRAGVHKTPGESVQLPDTDGIKSPILQAFPHGVEVGSLDLLVSRCVPVHEDLRNDSTQGLDLGSTHGLLTFRTLGLLVTVLADSAVDCDSDLVLCCAGDHAQKCIRKGSVKMFVWARIPEPYREMGSLGFAKFLVSEGKVATSPGHGFGPGGEGYIRFALIENEQRIAQGIRNLRAVLKL